jgi:hypothetical protein
MKEYTKKFEEVSYTFSENDLSAPFSSTLNKLKGDISEAKKRMGSCYTEEVDDKVQSLLDTFIISSFKLQVDMKSYILRRSSDVTPQNTIHCALSMGNLANEHIRIAKYFKMILQEF